MINVVYSTEHLIMPTIIAVVLVVLLAAIIITEGMARVKNGKGFFVKPGRFFREDADYFKLFGTLVLFAGYIFCMDIIGFTVTSIIFVFLFNCLYAGVSKKALIPSIIISIVAPLLVSIAFGVIFKITLPDGFMSLTFIDYGFTIY